MAGPASRSTMPRMSGENGAQRGNGRDNLDGRPRVVIAGGGVAALEAVLALRAQLADTVQIHLVAPQPHFDYVPLSVMEPFGAIESPRVELLAFCESQGVLLHPDRLTTVDPEARTAWTSEGAALPYDALLLAHGCRHEQGLRGSVRFSGHDDVVRLTGAIDHTEFAEASRIAFVVTDPQAWNLPLYELALLTRARLDEHGIRAAEVTILTPEDNPVELLGETASDTMHMLLARTGIQIRTGVEPLRAEDRAVVLASGERIEADHVVSLPHNVGIPIDGIPHDRDGFIPVDWHSRVIGVKGVYAAGDVVSGFPKQGGLAARQADAAAEAIAADLGAGNRPKPFEPILQAVLLTGDEPAAVVAAHETGDGTWQPPSKIAARHLTRYLGTRPPTSRFPDRWAASRGIPSEIEFAVWLEAND